MLWDVLNSAFRKSTRGHTNSELDKVFQNAEKKQYACLFVFSFTSHLRQFEFFVSAETAAFEKLLISILNLIFNADIVASMLMKRDPFGVTAAVW